MVINGKVYCFFEQSGTFKNEFIKLGILAEDYDIQNNFGETDHIVDLFAEIEAAWGGQKSIFNEITKDDLIIAFFPCIEFSCLAQLWYSLEQKDYAKWPYKKRIEYMLDKNKRRAYMYDLIMKFCGVCLIRGVRMIFENPWGINTYLKQNVFLKKPDLIDNDRTKRGDFFKKPTAFWYWNCKPTYGASYQKVQKDQVKSVCRAKKSPVAGVCSEERSTISPDYARNFISDFIIGKEQNISEPTLF